MPSIDTRPYLVPPKNLVEVGPWTLEKGELSIELPPELKDWDPGEDLVLKRLVQVDADQVCRAASLPVDARLAVVVCWRSVGSGQRGNALKRALESNGDSTIIDLEARLLGHELAGSVRIFTRVVLAGLGSGNRDRLCANRIGSVLWEDEAILLLEGIGSRFPMEIVDFSKFGFPLTASWRLVGQRNALFTQAMGSLCLLLNSRHPRVVAAATNRLSEIEARAIWSSIHLGVARELIISALKDDGFVEDQNQFEPGTVGNVAWTLLNRAFPRETPKAVAEKLAQSPDLFECQMQAGFHLFDPGKEI